MPRLDRSCPIIGSQDRPQSARGISAAQSRATPINLAKRSTARCSSGARGRRRQLDDENHSHPDTSWTISRASAPIERGRSLRHSLWRGMDLIDASINLPQSIAVDNGRAFARGTLDAWA
jgi:hypothetical protein